MSNPAQLAAALQSMMAALQAACVDPADAVRQLASLAAHVPDAGPTSPFAALNLPELPAPLNDLARRSAVAALARACCDYEPSSHDDAARLRDLVLAIIDREMTVAGDQGEDASFAALRDLGVAVAADLTARGADLAPIARFAPPTPMPAAVLALRYYGDAGRSGELVTHADPIHPAFMPLDFTALAS